MNLRFYYALVLTCIVGKLGAEFAAPQPFSTGIFGNHRSIATHLYRIGTLQEVGFDEKLKKVVEEGNTEKFNALFVKEDAYKNPELLRIAVALGHHDIVQHMQKAGVPLKAIDDYQRARTQEVDSILKKAIQFNHSGLAHYLAQSDLGFIEEAKTDPSFMEVAVEKNEIEVAIALLRRGAQPGAVLVPESLKKHIRAVCPEGSDSYNTTRCQHIGSMLQYMFVTHRVQVAQELPIHRAVHNQDIVVLERLLNAVPTVSMYEADVNGKTALILAAEGSNPEVFASVLKTWVMPLLHADLTDASKQELDSVKALLGTQLAALHLKYSKDDEKQQIINAHYGHVKQCLAMLDACVRDIKVEKLKREQQEICAEGMRENDEYLQRVAQEKHKVQEAENLKRLHEEKAEELEVVATRASQRFDAKLARYMAAASRIKSERS